MVEHRPLRSVASHLILIGGVAAVALPIYVAFVASTLSFDQVTTVPMPMLPGTELIDNYSEVIAHGSTLGSKAPVGRMMLNSLIMALTIADRQDRDLDPVRVRDRLFPLSAASRPSSG